MIHPVLNRYLLFFNMYFMFFDELLLKNDHLNPPREQIFQRLN